eukprot:m.265069 g.265069  ORF g.265069 m.265069 type:complete len:94 (+) comp26738_c0_seq2:4284-4565(+)
MTTRTSSAVSVQSEMESSATAASPLCWVDEVDLNHEVKAAVSAEAQSDEESAMRLVKRLLDSIYMRLLSVGNCQSGERSVDSLRFETARKRGA